MFMSICVYRNSIDIYRLYDSIFWYIHPRKPIFLQFANTFVFTSSGNELSKSAVSQFFPVVYSTGINASETTLPPWVGEPLPLLIYGIKGNPRTSS